MHMILRKEKDGSRLAIAMCEFDFIVHDILDELDGKFDDYIDVEFEESDEVYNAFHQFDYQAPKETRIKKMEYVIVWTTEIGTENEKRRELYKTRDEQFAYDVYANILNASHKTRLPNEKIIIERKPIT